MQIAQLREHEPEFKKSGATLAVVGLSDREHARQFRDESGIAFPLLVDEQQQAYHAIDLKKGNIFHLLWPSNIRARRRAKAAGHKQHRLGQDHFQLGASFIFGPGNIDIHKHLNKTFGDNAKVEDLVTAVACRAGW